MEIVAALEKGDVATAERLMSSHIGSVEAGLRRAPAQDALSHLRDALAPVAKGAPAAVTLPSLTPAPRAPHTAGASATTSIKPPPASRNTRPPTRRTR